MPPKKLATQHPVLAKQLNPATVQQPTQFKVPRKKRLTEKPADWTQEQWVADCERRRLLKGDRKDRRVAGAKKAASDYILCRRGLWARRASQGSTTGGVSRSSSPSSPVFYNEGPAAPT
jgi:hypothetical protein